MRALIKTEGHAQAARIRTRAFGASHSIGQCHHQCTIGHCSLELQQQQAHHDLEAPQCTSPCSSIVTKVTPSTRGRHRRHPLPTPLIGMHDGAILAHTSYENPRFHVPERQPYPQGTDRTAPVANKQVEERTLANT